MSKCQTPPLPPPFNTPSYRDPVRWRQTSTTSRKHPQRPGPVTVAENVPHFAPGIPRQEHKLDLHRARGERAPRHRPQLHSGPLSPQPPHSAGLGVPAGGPGPRPRGAAPVPKLAGAGACQWFRDAPQGCRAQSSHLKLPSRRPRLGVDRASACVPPAASGSRTRMREGW